MPRDEPPSKDDERAFLLEGDRRVRHNLQHLRIAAGLSLSEASERTGYLTQSLNRVELGQQRLYPSMVVDFAALYGIPVDELFAPMDAGAARHERLKRALGFMQAAHAITDHRLLEALLTMTRAILAVQADRMELPDA